MRPLYDHPSKKTLSLTDKLEANQYILHDSGVYISPESQAKFSDFEASYLAAREKEKRVLSISEIRKLPFVDNESVDFTLWRIRRKNINRFIRYLSSKNKKLRILDVGCGNGFFSNLMCEKGNTVVGLDVNLHELQQAAEAFKGSGIKWYFLDLLNENLNEDQFDLITFCCSFQYFAETHKLLQRCSELLNDNGEIHIIDSPFYDTDTRETARRNSIQYYKEMGTERMIPYYHHNTLDALSGFNYKFKYKPNMIFNRLFKNFDSPFPWICIPKK